MGNNLLIRALYKEFTGEFREKFPADAPISVQLAFLNDHMFSCLNGLEEIMFAAWADGIDAFDFLLASKVAYEEYQLRQGARAEKQKEVAKNE